VNRRRGHGEGSVFPYRDRYAAVVDLGWINGKRRRRWVYGTTEKEVLGKLRDLHRRQDGGEDLSRIPDSFGKWLDEWVTLKEREGTRASTLRGYRQQIKTHIRPGLGAVRLDKLTPTLIRRFLTGKLDEGLSATTVRHLHGLIRNALGDAEREELITRNVAKAVRPPSLPTTERRALSLEEGRRLVEQIKGDRLEALWVTAVILGLRRGELLGLKWDDLDTDAKLLRVRRTLQRVDASLDFVPPKTVRSRRTVHVPAVVLDRLRTHRAAQAADRLAAGIHWVDTGVIFASSIGTPMEPRNLDRAWHAVRARAELDWLRLHDLRHACATFLLASGASPRTVMQILGHSQIGLTMNTYTHVLPELERDALDEAARRLFG
jgi:integrase